MSDSGTESSSLAGRIPIPALALALLAVFGHVLDPNPDLESHRPPSTAREDPSAHIDRVTIPQWADPLLHERDYALTQNQAAQLDHYARDDAHPGESLTKRRGFDRLLQIWKMPVKGVVRGSLPRPPPGSDNDTLLVLPVIVPARPYPEMAEHRRRTRQACVAAMHARGFTSCDGGALSVVLVDLKQVDWIATMAEILRHPLAALAPTLAWLSNVPDSGPQKRLYTWQPLFFERYRHDTRKCLALVLWLPADWLDRRPLRTLEQIGVAMSNSLPASKRSIHMIGPNTSGLLSRMREELAHRPGRHRPWQLRIYSPWATNSEAHEPLDHAEEGGFVLGPAVGFNRCTLFEEDLAHAIADELRLRPSPGGCSEAKRVILIAERGAGYVEQFGASLEMQLASGSVSWRWYDRRLDGSLPRLQDSEANTQTAGKPPEAGTDTPAGGCAYPAEGRPRNDGLWRLAIALREEHQRQAINAIGVLGHDVHDKLLVIRALRKQLPSVHLFTTELDARYWQSDELAYTRNLLIASSYGLRVGALDYRRDTVAWAHRPDSNSFRSSYQTAAYVAFLSALDPKPGIKSWFHGLEHRLRPARVHEVGIRGAYDLSAQTGGALHPPPERSSPVVKHGVLLWVIMLTIHVAVSWIGQWLSPTAERSTFLHGALRRHAIYGSMLVIGLLLAIHIDAQHPAGEPWSTSLGISSWPTILIHFLALDIAAMSTVVIWRQQYAARQRVDVRHPDLYAPWWQPLKLCPSHHGVLSYLAACRIRCPGQRMPALLRSRQSPVARKLIFPLREIQLASVLLFSVLVPSVAVLALPLFMLLLFCLHRHLRIPGVIAAIAYVIVIILGYLLNTDISMPWVIQLASVLLFSVLAPSLAVLALPLFILLLFCLHRHLRIPGVIAAIAYVIVIILGFLLNTDISMPYRGAVNQTLYLTFVLSALAALLLLLATCCWLSLGLHYTAYWVHHTARSMAAFPDYAERMRVRLTYLADAGHATDTALIYPFVVLLVMCLAQMPVFDRWTWPGLSWAIAGTLLAIPIGLAVLNRGTGRSARRLILQRIRDLEDATPERASQLRTVRDRIAALDRGPFAPLAESPVVIAILTPLGGMGAISLVGGFL